ncbi:MAG: DNA polymerase III PolC-type [Steroidobacteraceae bacterium]|nr:DNA polymerase III PolC-type [Steroidobacteraceae bacterium]
MTALLDGPLAFVDVETTGGHPLYHRIVEIGVVLARGAAHEESWTTLVNPGVRLPPSIQYLTGIDPTALEAAPRFEDIAGDLARRLEGRLFIAHNARFDHGFVRQELRRTGRAFDARLVCTVKLSRRFHPELPRHNLDALIAYHDLPCAARHRALPDAMVLWQFWRRLRERWPAAEIEAALEAITRRVTLPPQLSPALVDELPEAAGVYRFFGEGDALLYVGQATNLRERVLAHWRSAPRSARAQRLATQTMRVDWTETAGELGARLLEARCVREQAPLYNRHPREEGDALTWHFSDTDAAAGLCALGDGWPEGDCFGLYRNERDARRALTRLAREHRLCLKLLGLESGAGSCIAYSLQRCRGACIGLEPAARHLARTKLALAGERLTPWPYDGAVAIRERGPGIAAWHIVDRWRYLGTITREDDTDENPAIGAAPDAGTRFTAPRGFDVDAYRVLARYLASRPSGVRPWPALA